jgi:hypothetical protein
MHFVYYCFVAGTISDSLRRNNRVPNDIGQALPKRNRKTPHAVKHDNASLDPPRHELEHWQIEPSEHFGRTKAVYGHNRNVALQSHSQKSLANDRVFVVGVCSFPRVPFKDLGNATWNDPYPIAILQGTLY